MIFFLLNFLEWLPVSWRKTNCRKSCLQHSQFFVWQIQILLHFSCSKYCSSAIFLHLLFVLLLFLSSLSVMNPSLIILFSCLGFTSLKVLILYFMMLHQWGVFPLHLLEEHLPVKPVSSLLPLCYYHCFLFVLTNQFLPLPVSWVLLLLLHFKQTSLSCAECIVYYHSAIFLL